MSVEELKDTIDMLRKEEKGMNGNFLSAADKKYFDQIPSMIEEMTKRLVSLQASGKNKSASIVPVDKQ